MGSHQQKQSGGFGAVSDETQEFDILVELLHVSLESPFGQTVDY